MTSATAGLQNADPQSIPSMITPTKVLQLDRRPMAVGDLVVSLGTSDTLFGVTSDPTPVHPCPLGPYIVYISWLLPSDSKLGYWAGA